MKGLKKTEALSDQDLMLWLDPTSSRETSLVNKSGIDALNRHPFAHWSDSLTTGSDSFGG